MTGMLQGLKIYVCIIKILLNYDPGSQLVITNTYAIPVCNIFLFANEIALKKFQWDATNQAIKNEYKTVYQMPSFTILEVHCKCLQTNDRQTNV